MKITKKCDHCGVVFTRHFSKKENSKGRKALCCSRKCNKEMTDKNHPIKTFTCKQCKKKFQRRYYKHLPTPHFCSNKCKYISVKENHKAPWLTKLNQEPGRNARISKATMKQRVDMLRDRGEGKTYRKREGQHEHRTIMEKKLGRKLKSTEFIHHKDGNIRNNAISNLKLITPSKHASDHIKKRRASGERVGRKTCK